MALVTITNLTGEVVLLQELYRNAQPYEAFTVTREKDELHAMPALQQLWHDGIIDVSVVPDAAEEDFIDTHLHTVTAASLYPSDPESVDATAASPGVSSLAARGDHKHDVVVGTPVAITDSTNAEGTADQLVRRDHQHAHGDRGGGSLHALATILVPGFMSPGDKTIVDNLPANPADADAATTFHEPIVTAEAGTNAPGQAPDLINIGSNLVAQFTVNTDVAYRMFKIPSYYVSDPSFHVHWTKEEGLQGDGDESGNAVKWRISYTVFDGSGGDINVTPSVLEYEDTYDDAGTTTRVVHRTPNLAAAGFVAGYYLGVSIGAVSPAGAALTCEPALISVDLIFTQYINQ